MFSIQNYGLKNGLTRDEQIGLQMVAVLLAGVLYFLFALIAYFAGAQRVKQLFPPVVVGPIVVVIGMTLAPTVIKSDIVDCYTVGSMKDYAVWSTALIIATVIICMSLFAKGIFKSLPLLFGILAAYIASACF
jgi:uracil permease